MHSRMQAMVLAVIGILFASPLPERVMSALSPQKSNADGEFFRHAADRGWMHFVEMAAPWTRVAGIAVAAFCVIWLVAKAGNGFITPRWPRAISYALAGCLGVVTGTMTVIDLPKVGGPASEIGSTLKRAQGGISGQSEWQATPSRNEAEPASKPKETPDRTSWSSGR